MLHTANLKLVLNDEDLPGVAKNENLRIFRMYIIKMLFLTTDCNAWVI